MLLPSRWTRRVPCGRLWNLRPAHGPQRTVLDDVPTPTDQKADVFNRADCAARHIAASVWRAPGRSSARQGSSCSELAVAAIADWSPALTSVKLASALNSARRCFHCRAPYAYPVRERRLVPDPPRRTRDQG